MDRQNMKNPDDELAPHHKCHAKWNAMEGPDLHGRGKYETTKRK